MSDFLAFDIGGTKIASGFVRLSDGDAAPTVLLRDEEPTHASQGGDAVRERIVASARRQLDRARAQGIEPCGIGIAAAGVPDGETGEIIAATDLLPGWKGQRIYDAFGAITDLPVHMVGDVVAHGLGEAHYGAGRGARVLLSVGVGTGIGGAIIVGGVPFLGAHGMAGHAGHVVSALGAGVPCSCGSVEGHVEPVASGTGLATLYNMRAGGEPVRNGGDVAALAADGDALASSVIEDSARALGACIGGMANLVDPDGIVVSGSVVNAGPVWWDALRDGFARSALPLLRDVRMREGELGGDAPLIGAAVASRRVVG
ncbi:MULTISPECIES: ROK family protein [Bifidobacterium]|uniref:N-acetyl-D-glucosamine kinase n=2 Tax=Bifidobacterium longum subsp. infantis TaxID=1682 RepID=A0A7D5BTT5_BIFLI|nr:MULTISPECIES: ROK family protein [Bifidobacterium]ACJ51751.1 ROK family protein [Bifidobacterium longum subsp. infantis ATCC 15697 = JCM 1222 = DSM 20088]KAB1944695.1 ROK family protein [Bifidobacterium longum subsp. infantis]KEY28049.1 ROK family transcriptional regulator [Bifidobacterium longum subsp. infantis EK3]MBX4248669.1 ROK family protein [Bifidobacterium longum subsp. infantis]MED7619734.1 ROK family protein [Bifidobacterium longum subsp. infantis]